MAKNNLAKLEIYMILSEYTSRLIGILRDRWNSLKISNKKIYLKSQYYFVNMRILLEVFCRDTIQRKENFNDNSLI